MREYGILGAALFIGYLLVDLVPEFELSLPGAAFDLGLAIVMTVIIWKWRRGRSLGR